MTITDFKRPKLELPSGANELLLYLCRAPCSDEVVEALQASGVDYTIFFYNPNIHPRKGYLTRKDENIRFAKQHNVPFIDADYDIDNWFERAKGMEWESGRGIRCTMCFDVHLEWTTLYAAENGFSAISSSPSISCWKNIQQADECERRTVAHYPGMVYWNCSQRKQGGSSRMIKVSKREEFYQREYCGCVHFLHDTNLRRKPQGRLLIKTGQSHYGKEEKE